MGSTTGQTGPQDPYQSLGKQQNYLKTNNKSNRSPLFNKQKNYFVDGDINSEIESVEQYNSYIKSRPFESENST